MSERQRVVAIAFAAVACSLLAQGAFGEAAPPAKTLGLDLGKGLKMDFILIPAGTFVMGDEKHDPNERPAHKVAISRPFHLGKTEVTQEQWQAVIGENPGLFKEANHPVESVSWNECQTFLGKLGEKFPGRKFRLPTEAEWEYACRAGTTAVFSFGDDPEQVRDYGWCLLNSAGGHSAVGRKRPNPWGLYDVHGNVWEWCQDWYGPYAKGEATDPAGPAAGEFRVVRGGSWFKDGASNLRSAGRYRAKPDGFFHNVGLRVLLSAQ